MCVSKHERVSDLVCFNRLFVWANTPGSDHPPSASFLHNDTNMHWFLMIEPKTGGQGKCNSQLCLIVPFLALFLPQLSLL